MLVKDTHRVKGEVATKLGIVGREKGSFDLTQGFFFGQLRNGLPLPHETKLGCPF